MALGESSQIILAAIQPLSPDAKEGAGRGSEHVGYLQKWDLATGVALGTTLKEFQSNADGCASVALLPPCPAFAARRADAAAPGDEAIPAVATPYFAALSAKSAALHYYQIDKERPCFRFHALDRLSAIAIAPGGAFLGAGNDVGSLYVWHIASGDLICVVEGAHFQRINVVRFSTDGALFVTASADGTVKVWQWAALVSSAAAAVPGRALYTFSAHSGPVTDVFVGVGINNNCRLYSSSRDQSILMHDLVDGQLLARFTFPSQIARLVMLCNEETLFAGAADGHVYLVDLSRQDPAKWDHFEGAPKRSRGAASYEAQGAAEEGSRPQGAAPMMLPSVTGHEVTSLSLSAAQSMLVVGDQGGTIAVWSITTRQLIRTIRVEGSTVKWLAVLDKCCLPPAAAPLSMLPAAGSASREPQCDAPKLVAAPPSRSRKERPLRYQSQVVTEQQREPLPPGGDDPAAPPAASRPEKEVQEEEEEEEGPSQSRIHDVFSRLVDYCLGAAIAKDAAPPSM